MKYSWIRICKEPKSSRSSFFASRERIDSVCCGEEGWTLFRSADFQYHHIWTKLCSIVVACVQDSQYYNWSSLPPNLACRFKAQHHKILQSLLREFCYHFFCMHNSISGPWYAPISYRSIVDYLLHCTFIYLFIVYLWATTSFFGGKEYVF